MIFRSSFARKPHRIGFDGFLLFFLIFLVGTAVADPPDPDEILRSARVNPLGQPIALEARLRHGSESTPFRIVVDGTVRYEFKDPEQALILELNDEESVLTETSKKGSLEVRAAAFDTPVRNTGISYEDLALKFLYWNNPKIIGEETIRTRSCWKFEIQAPRGGKSQYGVARLWIDKESGALLRMEGYDMRGKPIRRFEVVSARKIDGQWMLKQMRIEKVDPDSRKVVSRTYLEVLGKDET